MGLIWVFLDIALVVWFLQFLAQNDPSTYAVVLPIAVVLGVLNLIRVLV